MAVCLGGFSHCHRVYFVDAEGKSVLRLKAGAVLPLTGMEVPGDPEVIPADFVPDRSGEYNYKHNSVGYDHEKGLYYWRTSVPGNRHTSDNRNKHPTFLIRSPSIFVANVLVRGKIVSFLPRLVLWSWEHRPPG